MQIAKQAVSYFKRTANLSLCYRRDTKIAVHGLAIQIQTMQETAKIRSQ